MNWVWCVCQYVCAEEAGETERWDGDGDGGGGLTFRLKRAFSSPDMMGGVCERCCLWDGDIWWGGMWDADVWMSLAASSLVTLMVLRRAGKTACDHLLACQASTPEWAL